MIRSFPSTVVVKGSRRHTRHHTRRPSEIILSPPPVLSAPSFARPSFISIPQPAPSFYAPPAPLLHFAPFPALPAPVAAPQIPVIHLTKSQTRRLSGIIVNKPVVPPALPVFPLPSSPVATRATTSDVVLSAPLHTKARGLDDNGQITAYPRGGPVRYAVEDRVVHWDTPLPGYDPVEYTAPSVAAGPAWADPESPEGLRFGELDGKVDRTSFFPSGYKIVQRRPQNPMGRTGMKGRGLLGRWGPNHAADPVVTRWSPSNPAVLEFVAILRSDGGGWAIPGGMVEVGHSIGQTLRAEFAEEALNSLGKSEAERQTIDAALETLFDGGKCVYAGYVDDPRNTDNAWMETCCYHFHAESSSPLAQIELHAGDDAVGVKWTPITKDLKLYASHKMFIEAIGRKMGANPL